MLKKNYGTPFFLASLFFSTLSCFAVEPKNKTASSLDSKNEAPSSIARYLQLFKDHPETLGPLGKWRDGEIEITMNPEQIRKIENQMRLRLISKGVQEKDAEKWSSVGIIAEDSYWMWVRDAVIFPSGVYGTYDRLMWKNALNGFPTVAILPLLSTKKVVVNISYKHATRSWEIELPRGQKKPGESIEKAAARGLKEETGYQINKFTQLGTIAPDSGTLMSVVPVLCGEVSHSGESWRKYSKAILQNPAFSKEDLKEGFAKGYIEHPINGAIVKVNCRDSFLTFAILQAEMKGFL